MESACAVEGCNRPRKNRDWCGAHYQRWWLYGDVQAHIPVKAKRPTPELCAVEGCPRTKRIGDYCSPHGRRVQRNGSPGRPDIYVKAGHGKGESKVTRDNYRLVKAPVGHPNAYKNGRILEHTLVMSEVLGRSLLPGENVHHRNGDRLDNRPENLELWVTRQPKGQRVADKLAWAREIIALYGDLPPEVV